MNANAKLLVAGAGAALVVVVVAGFAARRAAGKVGDVAGALNPLNPGNVFIAGANALADVLKGDASLGGAVAELISADVKAANDAMTQMGPQFLPDDYEADADQSWRTFPWPRSGGASGSW